MCDASVRLDGQTVLVTGGGGFIGSHVTRGALDAGASVRVLDDLSGCGSWRRLRSTSGVELVEGSILDERSLLNAMEGVDTIFHLAAAVSVPESVADPMRYHQVDGTGTLLVLEVARRKGVRRVIYSSTSALYGDAPQQPKQESHPAAPTSPYGVAKYAGELYVSSYARLHGLQTLCLRYFNVFGPGQDPKSQYGAAIPNIVSRLAAGQPPSIFGDGEQTRDFCHVDNVVRANLLAAAATHADGAAMNIACGKAISLNEVVRIACDVLGVSIPPVYEAARPGDIRHSVADISLARRAIGYEPLVQFEEGLRKTIPAYLSTT